MHSTRSWDFLGVNLPTDLRPEIELESDVIVASIDTGIYDGGVCLSFTMSSNIHRRHAQNFLIHG